MEIKWIILLRWFLITLIVENDIKIKWKIEKWRPLIPWRILCIIQVYFRGTQWVTKANRYKPLSFQTTCDVLVFNLVPNAVSFVCISLPPGSVNWSTLDRAVSPVKAFWKLFESRVKIRCHFLDPVRTIEKNCCVLDGKMCCRIFFSSVIYRKVIAWVSSVLLRDLSEKD